MTYHEKCYQLYCLQVASTHNDPNVVRSYFLDGTKVFGAPRFLRTDCGTENVSFAAAMTYIHHVNAQMYGNSTANQRIEALWSKLRSMIIPWIDFIPEMVDDHLLVGHTVHMQIARYCFCHLVQHSLDEFMAYWKQHIVWNSSECPTGKPDMLFLSSHDHKTVVAFAVIEKVEGEFSTVTSVTGCDIMDEHCQYIQESLSL